MIISVINHGYGYGGYYCNGYMNRHMIMQMNVEMGDYLHMGLSWEMSSSLLHSLRSAHRETLATTSSLASSGYGTFR